MNTTTTSQLLSQLTYVARKNSFSWERRCNLRGHHIMESTTEDLKIRAFEPADAGQMNFYVNWFKANMKADGDNPPVGILLCSDRDGTEVEFATAGMDNALFVSRYLTALPSAAQLQRFLEHDRSRIESLMPSASLKRPGAQAHRKTARSKQVKSNPS